MEVISLQKGVLAMPTAMVLLLGDMQHLVSRKFPFQFDDTTHSLFYSSKLDAS